MFGIRHSPPLTASCAYVCGVCNRVAYTTSMRFAHAVQHARSIAHRCGCCGSRSILCVCVEFVCALRCKTISTTCAGALAAAIGVWQLFLRTRKGERRECGQRPRAADQRSQQSRCITLNRYLIDMHCSVRMVRKLQLMIRRRTKPECGI